MTIRHKFLSQQILTLLGTIGLIYIVIDAYLTNSWFLLFLSFIFSNLVVSLFCSQIILHRYFSHRSFQVNKYLHYMFSILSILPGQGSPIAWAAAHRHHHKNSDGPLDNHSPKESYFLAMGGWLLKGFNYVVVEKKLKTIPTDLLRDKFIYLIDKNYYYIWCILICIFAASHFKFFLYFLIAPIGWSLLIASFVTLGCHLKLYKSYRNYELNDNTHNNMIFQCLVLGDALHNNHHYDPSQYNLKVKKFEFDPAGLIIKIIKVK